MTGEPKALPVLEPGLQVSFHYRLKELRELYLQDALKRTVAGLGITRLDSELKEHVSAEALTRVASFGLRGEVLFPIPCVLEANPFLLGYYRLLFGLSQKEFYSKGPFGAFARMESHGEIPKGAAPALVALSRSLVQTAQMLVEGLDEISLAGVHDLQLLTLGAFMRGSELNRIGQRAAREVFALIEDILRPYVKQATAETIRIENESGRTVRVLFAGDPDVRVVEELASGERSLLSIEIKGGADASNVYNRIGEAEKSHLKEYDAGCREFWTIIRAAFKPERAKQNSPTTRHFFHFDQLQQQSSPEYTQFRDLLCSIVGIRSAPAHGSAREKRRNG